MSDWHAVLSARAPVLPEGWKYTVKGSGGLAIVNIYDRHHHVGQGKGLGHPDKLELAAIQQIAFHAHADLRRRLADGTVTLRDPSAGLHSTATVESTRSLRETTNTIGCVGVLVLGLVAFVWISVAMSMSDHGDAGTPSVGVHLPDRSTACRNSYDTMYQDRGTALDMGWPAYASEVCALDVG